MVDPRKVNQVLAALKINPEDQIIFIKENSFADSNFVITHLFKQLVYDKSNICFLTLHNTFDHYQNVGKKLGYDLKQVVEKGQLKIIDPLKELVDAIDLEDSSAQQIIRCLFDCIQTQINNFLISKESLVYLIIDDLSHLLDLGIDVPSVINFTNVCLNLTSDKNVCTIINSHVGSKSDLLVANNIQYVCDVCVSVSPLKTGQSADITGSMLVQRGSQQNKFHYKAFDKGIKTFLPGEALYK
ncbi:unnamed protein product [Ceutorhynchus assimilis]|uniref:Elongator complex protein 6 n=1 Tax=Ceutorhynchus assimilis TaxID=467358 RepID=A0A9N9QNS3_9CUCU|nr:unnamed protein product [Ceutorhynchus assimilis]